MTNSIPVTVRFSAALERELREIAKLAGVSVPTVVKMALAFEARRWQMERVEDGERE